MKKEINLTKDFKHNLSYIKRKNEIKVEKNKRITDSDFFSVNAAELAKKLLGKILIRNVNKEIIKVRIVETEAYDGKIDRACHAHPENKSQWKASSLYNRGGFTYVYLIYGIFHCFNIVSSNEGNPQGVLIRAVEPLDDNNRSKIYCYNGPGKLCRTLIIDISLDHVDLTTSSLIYLENQPEVDQDKIIVSRRINIDYAGKDDSERLWRFYIKDNAFVSRK